jgi:hypothetical protein
MIFPQHVNRRALPTWLDAEWDAGVHAPDRANAHAELGSQKCLDNGLASAERGDPYGSDNPRKPGDGKGGGFYFGKAGDGRQFKYRR